jgi:hypothetical protein
MSPCIARRDQDELVCALCRLRWDVADPEPPQCLRALRTLRVVSEREPFVSALAPNHR